MRNVAAGESIVIPVAGGQIEADLRLPDSATGLVIFAHGSGSSRFSSRNRSVAEALEGHGFGTLLLDLLTREEESVDVRTQEYRFDIDLLGWRVIRATDWTQDRPDLLHLPIGYFGASTGAAAALIGAAARPQVVRAVVSRGGRPDLAVQVLSQVKAPTLLIVGGDDEPVIGMNRDAMSQMRTVAELEIVSGATHLFEEAGALEQVIDLASGWFRRHLVT